MGMSIDEAINNLSGILTEATKDEDSVCYVTKDDAETLQVAIDIMRKYQKRAHLIKEEKAIYIMDLTSAQLWLYKIKEVVENGNDNI